LLLQGVGNFSRKRYDITVMFPKFDRHILRRRIYYFVFLTPNNSFKKHLFFSSVVIINCVTMASSHLTSLLYYYYYYDITFDEFFSINSNGTIRALHRVIRDFLKSTKCPDLNVWCSTSIRLANFYHTLYTTMYV